LDKEVSIKWLPFKEYVFYNTPSRNVIMLAVDYSKKKVTLFEQTTGNVFKQTLDWCEENLYLKKEF